MSVDDDSSSKDTNFKFNIVILIVFTEPYYVPGTTLSISEANFISSSQVSLAQGHTVGINLRSVLPQLLASTTLNSHKPLLYPNLVSHEDLSQVFINSSQIHPIFTTSKQ